MNTVATGILVKTVAMEKDILSCDPVDQQAPNFTRDLETFVEVVDKEVGSSLALLTAKVIVSTCDRINTSAITSVACSRTVPALPLGSAPSLEGCTLVAQQLVDPVVMNSVRPADGKVVKTIKVEKEIYTCPHDGGTDIRDVYVFTQLLEAVNATGDNFGATGVRWLGVSCERDTALGAVVNCVRFTPGPLQ